MCVKNNITGSVVENTFQNRKKLLLTATEQVNMYVNYEIDKYQAWAEDEVFNLNNYVLDIRRELELIRRQIRKQHNARNRIQMLKEEQTLTKKWRDKQQKQFDKEDECNEKIDLMVRNLKNDMSNNFNVSVLFRIRWSI